MSDPRSPRVRSAEETILDLHAKVESDAKVIAALRAALRAIYDEDHDEEAQPGRYADIAARALGINEQNAAIFNPDGTTIS